MDSDRIKQVDTSKLEKAIDEGLTAREKKLVRLGLQVGHQIGEILQGYISNGYIENYTEYRKVQKKYEELQDKLF